LSSTYKKCRVLSVFGDMVDDSAGRRRGCLQLLAPDDW